MDQVLVREGRSEIIIYTDRHFPDELSTLREAARILQREVLKRESDSNSRIGRAPDDHKLPFRP